MYACHSARPPLLLPAASAACRRRFARPVPFPSAASSVCCCLHLLQSGCFIESRVLSALNCLLQRLHLRPCLRTALTVVGAQLFLQMSLELLDLLRRLHRLRLQFLDLLRRLRVLLL